jgi:hypothetical protein
MAREDLIARIDNEDVYLIEFPVGDWSDDGHGKCEYYWVKSMKPVRDVREAHFKVKEVFGFNIGKICGEYEENYLDKKVTEKLKELGYDFKVFENYNDEGNPTELGAEQVIDIWLYLLNHIDPELKLRVLNYDAPGINYYGGDAKRRHLDTPGYGCFSCE